MKILPKILGTVFSIVVGAVFGLATAHATDLIVASPHSPASSEALLLGYGSPPIMPIPTQTPQH